jgi:maleate cis-trans isomerase
MPQAGPRLSWATWHLGRSSPVLESNQVLLWSILARMEADIDVGGYGRLFDRR